MTHVDATVSPLRRISFVSWQLSRPDTIISNVHTVSWTN